MKGIDKAARIMAKILEVSHWVGAGLMAAIGICAVTVPQRLKYFLDVNALKQEREISVYGFEVAAADSAGEIHMTALLLFSIGAVLILSLMAMVFRNLYLIIKKSEGTTPFQKDNIRMLREIGIFSMVIPVVSLIMSTIIRLAVGVDAVEISIHMDGFIMGIIVLSLTQFFAHGAELEKDVEGLL